MTVKKQATAPAPVSLDSLNARAAHAKGFEFELEYPPGRGLGVFLSVLGDQADEVEAFEVAIADKRAETVFAQAKTDAKTTRSMKDSLAENVDRAVMRVVGWRGLAEVFTVARARTLLERNPDFVDQVLTASRSRANFTTA